MCGRFTQSFTWAEIVELYNLLDEIAPGLSFAPSYNVAPTHNAGVIVSAEGGLRFQPMRWGLVPFWAKDPSIGSKLINARSDTLAVKPAFRNALKSRRCIVPVSGFYEWQKQGKGKQPFLIADAGGKPLTLAGLWECWNDLLTFTIITVPANESLSPLHDRMPAILSRESAVEWLNTGDLALIQPAAQPLAIWPVSSRVNSPANNDVRLTEDISAGSSRPAANSAENQGGNKTGQLALAL